MTANEFAPVTPGEMLRQEFLAEYRLSQNQLAKAVWHFAKQDRRNCRQSPAHYSRHFSPAQLVLR